MGKLPRNVSTPEKTPLGKSERTPTTVHDIKLQNELIQRLRNVTPIPGMHLRFPGAESQEAMQRRLLAWFKSNVEPFDD